MPLGYRRIRRSSSIMRTMDVALKPIGLVALARASCRSVSTAGDIPWGVKIIEYRGALISDDEAKRRYRRGADAIMDVGDGLNIDGRDRGNGAAFANHSRRNPNCFLLREGHQVWLVAGIEGIKAGEELTYDYGSEYYPRGRRSRRSAFKK